MRTEPKLLILMATSLLGACAAADRQDVSGSVRQTDFPAPITSVRVMQGTSMVTESPVDAAGRFAISVGPGRHYRIELMSGDVATAGLMFPRKTGGIDRGFDVYYPGDPLDVGVVQYLGDTTGVTFHFDCTTDDPPGTVCVDDEADGSNNQEGVDELDGANNQCGVDEPDGDNNQVGDQQPDGENDLDTDVAVGDDNVPADVGCDSDDGPGTDEPGPDDETPPGDETPPAPEAPPVT